MLYKSIIPYGVRYIDVDMNSVILEKEGEINDCDRFLINILGKSKNTWLYRSDIENSYEPMSESLCVCPNCGMPLNGMPNTINNTEYTIAIPMFTGTLEEIDKVKANLAYETSLGRFIYVCHSALPTPDIKA